VAGRPAGARRLTLVVRIAISQAAFEAIARTLPLGGVAFQNKIGAKVVSHGRCVAFQMAEVAIPRNLFADILRLISELRPPPVTSTA
jgi:hypothetical protein